MEIKLTKGYVAIIDDVDADLVQYKWHFSDKGTSTCAQRRDYSIERKYGKLKRMHREILERKIGRKLESHELCDHIDGNSLNNSRSNLRIATKAQNAWNAKLPRTNKSGYKGVHLHRPGRWVSTIKVNNKTVHLGVFLSPEAAYEAYCQATALYHGEFARLS